MCRVEYHSIHSFSHKSSHTIHKIARDTYTGSYTQTTFIILARIWKILQFGNVFVSNQTHELTFAHYRQFLNSMLLQYANHVLRIGIIDGNQVFARHHFCNQSTHIRLKTKVTIGNNANERHILIHHGDSADMILLHHLQRIAYSLILADGDRVADHAILCTFHPAHFRRLLCNRHILMNDTDATLAGQRDCHR